MIPIILPSGISKLIDEIVCLFIESELFFEIFKCSGMVVLAAVGSLHSIFFVKQFMIHDEINGKVRVTAIIKCPADGDCIGLGGIRA